MFAPLTQLQSSKIDAFHCCKTLTTDCGKNELKSMIKLAVRGFRVEAIARTSCILS